MRYTIVHCMRTFIHIRTRPLETSPINQLGLHVLRRYSLKIKDASREDMTLHG